MNINQNREIKFRVWNKKTNTWVHGPGEEVNLFGEMILLGGFMKGVGVEELNDCVTLQYTGLKDRKNKEIYEGDILKWGPDTYIIQYSDACFEANLIYMEPEDSPGFLFDMNKKSKIIGNVFENPELLI